MDQGLRVLADMVNQGCVVFFIRHGKPIIDHNGKEGLSPDGIMQVQKQATYIRESYDTRKKGALVFHAGNERTEETAHFLVDFSGLTAEFRKLKMLSNKHAAWRALLTNLKWARRFLSTYRWLIKVRSSLPPHDRSINDVMRVVGPERQDVMRELMLTYATALFRQAEPMIRAYISQHNTAPQFIVFCASEVSAQVGFREIFRAVWPEHSRAIEQIEQMPLHHAGTLIISQTNYELR